jgi:phenylpropionate dioxygenase-like ring-hydroxylating dioxygenase large terminal subunit
MKNYPEELKPYWLIVCRSKELKTKPYAASILDIPLVIFRSNNKIAALIDRCPHRNIALSKGKIKNGLIECAYHGWKFDETGKCQKIPGQLCGKTIPDIKIANFRIEEKYGFIWINLSESNESIYAPPFLDQKNYYNFIWPTEISGSLINILENFLDANHTHFVHSGLIRKDSSRQKVSAIIKKSAMQVEVKYEGEPKQSGFISQLFERNRHESYGRFILPSIAQLEYRSNKATEIIITAYITPSFKQNHKIYAVISIKNNFKTGLLKLCLIWPFFKLALKQDKKVLKLQQQNLEKFSKEEFISTPIDIIRPHIQLLLNGNKKELDKQIELLI